MTSSALIDLASSLARGNVALWLGSDWQLPDDPAARGELTTMEWLGIWAEPSDGSFADSLAKSRKMTSSPRILVEVPNLIEDDLGDNFSFAEICPYFYMRGKAGHTDHLGKGKRERSRGKKKELLRRLRRGVLLIDGYRDVEKLRDELEDIIDEAPELRRLVVVGLQQQRAELLLTGLNRNLARRVDVILEDLSSVLKQAAVRQEGISPGTGIRIGTQFIDISRLLATRSPVDEDFALVLERDIRPPEQNESQSGLLADLLSGRRLPWRALAHDLAWKRSSLSYQQDVIDWLSGLDQNERTIAVLDLPAESGSGLTILLQQIAFAAASLGFPTLLHRPQGAFTNYDRLRTFLTDLYQHPLLGPRGRDVPALIVFDSPSIQSDLGLLRELPGRLAHDGRRAVILRGLPLNEGDETDTSYLRPYRVARRHFLYQESFDPLRSVLTSPERDDLTAWARDVFARTSQDLPQRTFDIIQGWDDAASGVPLLICLHFILTDELSASAGLGAHLLNRVKAITQTGRDTIRPRADDPDRPLTAKEAKALLTLGATGFPDAPPSRKNLATALIALASLSSLGINIPRTVLSDVVGVPPSEMLRIVSALERCDLVSSVMGVNSTMAPSLAPTAFYSTDETVSLRHNAYGDIILDWLLHEEAAPDWQEHLTEDLASECLAERANPTDRNFPIEQLRPVLSRLKPDYMAGHIRFAENVAQRYLRVQRRFYGKITASEEQRDLAKWKWSHRHKLRDAFNWIPEAVTRQSPPLLHGRALTRYKTCSLSEPLDVCRDRYLKSVEDLRTAIGLARSHDAGERPATMITSLGHLYLGWSERERIEGHTDDWHALQQKVEETFREAIKERRDNPPAACGLAEYLIARVEDELKENKWARREAPEQRAADISEVLELLSGEPDQYYEEEWSSLRARVLKLLNEQQARSLIRQLKDQHNELGFALEALQCLQGRIPKALSDLEDTAMISDVSSAATETEMRRVRRKALARLRVASRSLAAAERDPQIKRSSIGRLLRYALFSADPVRSDRPAYQERYELIEQLEDSRYLEDPIWLFDYAMLSCQVGRFKQAAEAFARLRQGARFFEVPRERSCLLADGPDSRNARKVALRVVSTSDGDQKGWGRVDQPIHYPEPVPFSVRAFRSRTKDTRVGALNSCFIRLNPAGPFAEPTDR